MPTRLLVARMLLVILTLSCFVLLGCGDDDGGGGQGSITDGQGSVTIQGNVAQVMTAMQPVDATTTRFAALQDFFTLVRTAHAQATTGNLGGIEVTATLNNIVIAQTTTDENGNFELRVSPGVVTVSYELNGETVTQEITVLEFTTITMTVSLDTVEETVTVENMLVEAKHIDCDEALEPDSQSELVVDGSNDDGQGEFESCITAGGGCDLHVKAATITLRNCNHCVETSGNAQVKLWADHAINCEAEDVALITTGTSDVVMMTGHEVEDDGMIEEPMMSVTRNETQEINGDPETDETDKIVINAPSIADVRGNSSTSLSSEYVNLTATESVLEASGNPTFMVTATVGDDETEMIEDGGDTEEPVPTTNVARDVEETDGVTPQAGTIEVHSDGHGVILNGAPIVSFSAAVAVIMNTELTTADLTGSSSLTIEAGFSGATESLAMGGTVNIASLAAEVAVAANANSSQVIIQASACTVDGDVPPNGDGIAICE